MKFIKANTDVSLDNMQLTKMILTVNGDNAESIWVKTHDDKAYLQNHSFNFFPFPSWGLEVPRGEEFDLAGIRGERPTDVIMTIHPEAFEQMLEAKAIDEEGNFLPDNYFKKQEDESN